MSGLSVPDDLAVIGMDDEPMSAFLQPSLTTVRLDMIDFAHHLWARARAVLDAAPVPRLPAARWVRLVHRDSG